MTNRRQFVKQSSMLGLGTAMLPSTFRSLFSTAAFAPPGVQLFTLFNVIEDDVRGNLKKLADLGYVEIESAFGKKPGYYGLKPKEFAAILKDLGLKWKSHHVLGSPFKLPKGTKLPDGPDGKPMKIPPMRNLRDNMQQLVDEVAEGGVEYLVCAGTDIATSASIKQSVQTLNNTAIAAKKAGLHFCYHNHDREFAPVDGKLPYDIFLADTDPKLMKMELDLCWVTKAGVDPVALFKKHPGRFPLWHVKDLDKERKGPAPVGEGVIDFKRIFANAQLAGMQYYFVEHDMPADPFASLKTSIEALKKITA
jgi:sugar phosphate isomerase/epimerase